MNIPKLFQSSVDPTQVSLTISSIGKAVGYLIVFLGAAGIVDPMIAGQDWSAFVQAIIAGIPAGFAVYHTGMAVFGLIRKISVRAITINWSALFTTATTPPAQQ